MKVLFLDDSYRREDRIFGYGGFCIDGSQVRALGDEVARLKERFGIPRGVELKWSPPRGHFLRGRFQGVRRELYREALAILAGHEARVVCAVHFFNACYGYQLHRWTLERTMRWAARQQMTFLAERFHRPYLAAESDSGMIIVDEYADRDVREEILRGFSLDMLFGTDFEKLDRISMLPLMTASRLSPQVQLADIVAGVIVAAVGGSRYGLQLFDQLAELFLWNPHQGAASFASLFSSAVIGFGLKVFPTGCAGEARKLFNQLDQKYVVTDKGLVRRKSSVARRV